MMIGTQLSLGAIHKSTVKFINLSQTRRETWERTHTRSELTGGTEREGGVKQAVRDVRSDGESVAALAGMQQGKVSQTGIAISSFFLAPSGKHTATSNAEVLLCGFFHPRNQQWLK